MSAAEALAKGTLMPSSELHFACRPELTSRKYSGPKEPGLLRAGSAIGNDVVMIV